MDRNPVLFNKTLVIGVIILLIGIFANPSIGTIVEKESNNPITNGNTLYVGGTGEGNYTSIQGAIDDASDGDTIYVYNGTYYEHITLNKQLYLIGEHKNVTFIDGGGSGNAVYITANGIHILGFTIRNNGNSRGMYLIGSSYNNFYNNHFEHSGYEALERIRFESGCNNNWFHNNTISSINIRTLYNCDYNLWEYNSFDYGGISLNPDGNYNTIRYNYFGNISGCSPSQSSHYNEVYCNTFVNGWFQISDVQESHDNIVYHNNFIDCWINVKFSGNYMYNPTLQEGNYWSDFDEPSEGAWDNNSDGIVDYPYTVPGDANAQDLYPLIHLYGPPYAEFTYDNETSIFNASLSGDYNGEIVEWSWSFGDGTTGNGEVVYHKYCEVGTYFVILKVFDNDGFDDHYYKNVDVIIADTPPELKIYGPNSGKPGVEYEYVFDVIDPDPDDFYIWVDWGDGDSTGWIGPYLGGEQIKHSHIWNETGTYIIKAKMRDFCSESDWAELEVEIPRYRATYNSLFLWLLERFPLLERLLNLLR